MSDISHNEVVPDKIMDLEKGDNNNHVQLNPEQENFIEMFDNVRSKFMEQYNGENIINEKYNDSDNNLEEDDIIDTDTHMVSQKDKVIPGIFYKKTINGSTVNYHSKAVLTKWLNSMDVKKISIWEKLWFYIKSLYNNKDNKFEFIQYMGELTTLYEDSSKRLVEIKELGKKIILQGEDNVNKDPLYFLYESYDDITITFLRIDEFLRSYMSFMRLCSAPVDLFLEQYFETRSNCCGLIELVHSEITPNVCMSVLEEKTETVFVDFKNCKDKHAKELFKKQVTYCSKLQCSLLNKTFDRVYITQKRVADLHNILGELLGMSEFIKTSVEMNDQLLFRVLMLFGSFLTLLGEYVWNTQLKQYHYD